LKTFEMVLIGLSGARAKMINEKIFWKKSRDSVPFVYTIPNLFFGLAQCLWSLIASLYSKANTSYSRKIVDLLLIIYF
jgi:hypothetical protein